MKRIWVAAILLAAVIAVGAIATNSYAFKIPSNVSDVADAPGDMAYEACQGWEKQHENNTAYNMDNIRGEMSGKDFENIITETSKPDRLELRATYQKFATVKVRCNKEKCYSIWCEK
jgi:hypothetical protein